MRICITTLLVFYAIAVLAQEAIGLKFDSYSSLESIYLNPALSHDADCNFEISLGGAHAYANTDYASIRKTNLLSLRSLDTIPVHYSPNNIPNNPSIPTLIFDENGGNKNISLAYELSGPAFIWKVSPDLKVGAFSKFRGALSSFDIPENYGGYELSESEETGVIYSDIASLTMLMWKEAGIHISQRINNFVLGINARYIMPTAAGIARLHSYNELDYTNGISEVPLNADLSFTTNAEDFRSIKDGLTAGHNGNGYGIDVGLSYLTYGFSLSASVIDIGMARNITNTKHFYLTADGNENLTLNTNEYVAFTTLDSYLNKVDEDLPLIKETNDGMTIHLPTAISLQAHIRVAPKLNVSAAWVQRIPYILTNVKRNVNTLYRDNTISISPRYQTKWLSAALPLTIHEYKSVHIGASLRLGYLSIGSDNVLSLLGKTDFNGTDIYAKFSFFPFWKQRIKKKKKRKVKKENSKNKNVKCYSF